MNVNSTTRFEAELAKVSEYWSPRVIGRVNDQGRQAQGRIALARARQRG